MASTTTHTTNDKDGIKVGSVDLTELLGSLDKVLGCLIRLELLALLVVLEGFDRVLIEGSSSTCRAGSDELDAILELVVRVGSLGKVPSNLLAVCGC